MAKAKKKAARRKVPGRQVDPHRAFIRETLAANPRTKHGTNLADEVTRVVPVTSMPGFQRARVGGRKTGVQRRIEIAAGCLESQTAEVVRRGREAGSPDLLVEGHTGAGQPAGVAARIIDCAVKMAVLR